MKPVPIGGPLAGIMAKLVIRYKESTALESFKSELKLYLHYVDNVCIVWNGAHNEQSLTDKLSDDTLGLKIKIEQSSNIAFHFLDIWVETENMLRTYTANLYIALF